MNLTIDIECVKTQNPEHIAAIRAECEASRDQLLACVKAPSNYKDPEKIAAYCDVERASILAGFEAEFAAAVDKTVFDGGLGQIVCIAWAVNDSEPQSLHVSDFSDEQEAALLATWFRELQKLHSTHGTRPLVVGFNHVGFDLPYIHKRAVIYGIRPPLWFPRNVKPWTDSVFDVMTQWAGDRDRISMDKLCRILGIPGKQGISGADVWPMAQRGEFAAIADYCRDDVTRARAMHRRMVFA